MRRRYAARSIVVCCFALLAALSAASVAYADTSSGYTVWADLGLDHGQIHDTPHNGYATTTTKCAVCHAVHKGSASGEVLLQSSVAEACVYCHVTTNIGIIVIYNGDEDLYTVDNKKNHSSGGGAPCSGCHSAHGGGTYGGALTTKILRRLPIQPEFKDWIVGSGGTDQDFYDGTFPYTDAGGYVFAAPPYDWEEWGEPRWVQETAFCSGCHPYFTHASEDPITTNRMIVNGAISTDTRTFASHPMKRQWNGIDGDGNEIYDFQAAGSTLPAGTRVAFMSTNGCNRCHADGFGVNSWGGVQDSSYPHYMVNNERFLISQDDLGNYGAPTENSSQDGTCLLCHVRYDWDGIPGNNVGVGYTY